MYTVYGVVPENISMHGMSLGVDITLFILTPYLPFEPTLLAEPQCVFMTSTCALL